MNELELQIAVIDNELAELNRLLENDALYEKPTVLYHEPHQIPGFNELLEQQKAVTAKLKSYLQKRFAERHIQLKKTEDEYLTKYRIWQKRLRKLEALDPPTSAPLFPMDRSASVSTVSGSLNGRSTRRIGISDAVRSEEEMNRVLLSLLEQERDNPATRWMGTLAVTPMMLVCEPKHIFDDLYLDHNGQLAPSIFQKHSFGYLCAESVVHYNGSVVWTEAEQRIFIDKFMAFPKNFRKIASYLPFKKTADCIAFYYRNKKILKLKQMRKMAASEANSSKVKLSKKVIGPGRPPKKASKTKKPRALPSSSMDENSELSSTAASSLLSLSAIMNSPKDNYHDKNDQM